MKRAGRVLKATYKDIKADILSKILQGIWAPGSLLPNEVALAESYECARATVNRAMRELAEDGFIERKRKAGSRVRLSPVRQAKFDIPIVRREIEEHGAQYRYALEQSEACVPPDWLRARLQLSNTAQVLHLTCMHYADGAPYQLEDRWINLTLLPQARDADFTTVGPNEWLVSQVPFSNAEISFSATAADQTIADHLGCPIDAPVFQVERSTWWTDQAVTTVRLWHRPGHRMTTRY